MSFCLVSSALSQRLFDLPRRLFETLFSELRTVYNAGLECSSSPRRMEMCLRVRRLEPRAFPPLPEYAPLLSLFSQSCPCRVASFRPDRRLPTAVDPKPAPPTTYGHFRMPVPCPVAKSRPPFIAVCIFNIDYQSSENHKCAKLHMEVDSDGISRIILQRGH